MCAHRSDGAMGIVVNQRAAEMQISKLLVQLEIVTEADAIRLPRRGRRHPGAARRARRHRPRLRPAFGRLFGGRFDRAGRRRSQPDGDARHSARHRQRRRAEARGAGAGLRRLGAPVSSKARSSPTPGWSAPPTPRCCSATISPASTITLWNLSAPARRTCRPTPDTPSRRDSRFPRRPRSGRPAASRRRRDRRP